MAIKEIHYLDIGTSFELTVYNTEDDVSSILDLSTATSMLITFQKPDTTTVVQTATLVTDGADGKMTYISVLNDIDQLGTWKIQGKVTNLLGTWHTDISKFKVYDNLI